MGKQVRIPGVIDPHVHLRGMDWSHKGTFTTETAAAVAGGFWAVLDMPNTPPSTLDVAALRRKQSEMTEQSICDYGIYFCASAGGNWGLFPDILDDVCGVKMFNNSTTGDLLVEDPAVREQHYQHWPPHKPFVNHAENETCAEVIELVRKYRKPTHILHVCTAYEVEILTQAKADGLPITFGVCPHHLWLTEDDVSRIGSLGWMKPNLQTKADQDALWDALSKELVDIIESDHAPHTLEEKSGEPPPYGVTGLETTLPLLFTAVHEGRLSLEQVIDLVAVNPRKIFGLDCPDDTFTVIDLDTTYVIERENLHTKAGWSPFEGMRVQGKVVETWIRGTKVYDGEQVLVEPGFGHNLYD